MSRYNNEIWSDYCLLVCWNHRSFTTLPKEKLF